MPTVQDEADDLFGGAPVPTSPLPGKPAAGPGADNRKETRVRTNWQARVLLPDQRIVELQVHDLSESGVGLVSEIGIPAHTVLQVALAVPGLNDPNRITAVTGTIKTTHMTVKGHFVHCGGMWVTIAQDQRELVNQWIRRLRK
jgi:hypothetical protein